MIDLNTYLGDKNAQQDQSINGHLASLWTALPGIIQSFNAQEMTCEVQPAIQGKVRNEDGSIALVNLPLLLDCPVIFPRGGGCSLTFPIRQGDECLVIFSARAIDLWWQSGGVQPPVEVRMHDLSDGFVLPGPYSQPQVLPSVSTSAVQLRSDDGQAFFELNPQTHNFTLSTPGNFSATVKDFSVSCENFTVNAQAIVLTAPTIELNGQITGGGSGGATATFTGDINASGDVTAGGISLQTHVHGGIQPGGSDTGAPK